LIGREPDPPERVQLASLLASARRPTDAERTRALEYLGRYARALADEGVAADRREPEAWSSLARALLASNEFLFVD